MLQPLMVAGIDIPEDPKCCMHIRLLYQPSSCTGHDAEPPSGLMLS